MAGKEFTAKISVDVSELKKSMQEAKQQAAMANAEFETVAATMDDWTKSSEGLSAKLNALEKTLKSQETVLSVYEASLAETREEYDKNGQKIESLKAKLQDLASNGISKTSDEYARLENDLKAQIKVLSSYERQLANQRKSYDDNSKKVEQLKAKLQQLAKDGVSETSDEFKKYQAELTKAEKAQARNQSKISDLNAKIVTQRDVVSKAQTAFDGYAKELNDTEKEYSELTAKQDAAKKSIDDLSLKVQNQKTEIAKTQKSMSEYSDESEKLGKAVEDAADSASEAGNGGFTVLKGALANLAADGIRLALDGLKKLGSAIIDVGKQSLGNYAEYEQLVGGVETLFKDSAKEVQKYANNAYKTAGLSANDYMETVTSFSASLLQGLDGDTAKAAKIADRAITDMSDNANKMGTSIDTIQTAYQGFAKQNYTMLDNLKLGYGGTQKEMARLINDSGVLGDTMKVTEKNVNEVSFDKIIEAIHVVQDEMGITGTTAKEAAETIEGSKNAMQASWQNLLTGLADENADLGALFETFMESAETYLGNILPRIETLVGNAVDFVKEKLQEKFPDAMKVVENVFGTLKDAFGWVKDNSDYIIAAIAGIGAALVAWNLATVVTNVIKMVKALKAMGAASAFAAAKQWLLNSALLANPIGLVVAAIAGLVAAFVVLWKRSEKFRNFWIGLWDKIKNAVSTAIDSVTGVFNKVIDFFKNNWQSILLFIISPFAGVFKYLYDNFEGFKKFVDGVVEAIKGFFANAGEKIKEIWNGIKSFFSGIWASIKSIFSAAMQAIIDYFQPVIDFYTAAWNIIKELAAGCWEMIKAIWSVVATWFNENIIQPVVQFFTDLWETIKENAAAAWDFIVSVWQVVSSWFNENVIQPVSQFFVDLWNGIKTAASTAWNFIKSVWHSVSGWFNNTIIQPVAKFFSGMWDGLKNGAKLAWEGIKSVFGVVVDWFKDKFSKAWQAVKDVFSTGGKVFDGIKEGIVSAFKTVVNAIIRGINKVIAIPFNAINGILDKIQNVDIAGIRPFDGLVHRLPVPEIPELARGGVLKRGQVGLLEGDGAEAVVPLENNKRWIAATAADLKKALVSEGVISAKGGSSSSVTNNYHFTQNNTSPKALSRLEIYRQSKNLLHMKGAT